MFARFLMLASVLFIVSACSHNKDKTAMDQQGMATQESSATGAAGVGGACTSPVREAGHTDVGVQCRRATTLSPIPARFREA